MKKILALVVIIVLVGIAVYMFSTKDGVTPLVSPTPTPTPVSSVEASPTASPVSEAPKTVITYTDSAGYSPSTVTVKAGDIVVFENKGTTMMWTASAMHPTHKAYPGSDIEKCNTAGQSGIFDACKGYGSGESWVFEIREKGTWKYHNHLQPKHFGTIIVE